MQLYKIADQLSSAQAMLELSDDEPIDKDKLTQSLNELELEFKVKVENIAKIVLDYEGSLDATDKEIARLTKRKK
ncbi:MAG: siphovirus Gp157 family protein, partial [Lutibacter sp.]